MMLMVEPWVVLKARAAEDVHRRRRAGQAAHGRR